MTCFVLPSPALLSACDTGDTRLAYNAMPFGVINCSKPSLGFEATQTNEFGDEVGLGASAGGKTVDSLSVLFASYACETSGHWNTGDCVTTPGATFEMTSDNPITATIYAGDTCTADGCTQGR